MSEPSRTLFENGITVETVSTGEVVKWTRAGGSSRLCLPPIQRSVVWRNAQIINYWDSLLRGYPAGLMMVHSPNPDAMRARTSDGNTVRIGLGDFQLFDGQQRLTAILLGLGEGQLNNRLRLWVDLGCEPSAQSDLRFVLRISSGGQPFGYQIAAPNEKQPLYKRREKADAWTKRTGAARFDSRQAFAGSVGRDLTDAVCAIPLQEIIGLLLTPGTDDQKIREKYPEMPAEALESFVDALRRALRTPILFQLIDLSVINREDEYIRFFGRLGQGGTALTNDELTYSIIKHQHPEVHDRMQEIVKGPAGRVAGEVNLVLAALRIAKVSAPWNDSADWQIFGRPHPAFVSKLRDLPHVMEEFQRLIPESPGGMLKDLLESIRGRLVYDRANNPTGLPVILLARLPHQLVDVLLLMESQRPEVEEPAHLLPAFALYWLLFVSDDEKAANIIFKRFCLKVEAWRPAADKALIRVFEEQGISHRLPCRILLNEAREEILRGNHLLKEWGERFVAFDANKDRPTGGALRMLSTHGELIRRALLWLQREYLSTEFADYDPTSSRDEDLPIDLDHLIPRSTFGEDWRIQQRLLSYVDEQGNFRHRRWTVGNSLGNYRWLDASDNRSRQADDIDEAGGRKHFINEVPRWNALIKKRTWSEDDVAAFQRMIDLRSLTVFETLLVEGRLDLFATDAEPVLKSPEI